MNWHEELQAETAKGFTRALSTSNFPGDYIPSLYHTAIALFSLEIREVIEEWAYVLKEICKVAPIELLMHECVPFCMEISHVNSPVILRKSSTKMVSGIIQSLGLGAPRDIMSKIYSLCRDPYNEIRRSMAVEFCDMSRVLGETFTQSVLFPHLYEICTDEEPEIRTEGLRVLIDLPDMFTYEFTVRKILPVLIGELSSGCTKAISHILAENIGKIVVGYEPEMNQEEFRNTVLEFYCNLREGNSEMRMHMALNFTKILQTLGSEGYDHELRGVHAAIIADTSIEVKSIGLSCLHEVIKIMGNSPKVSGMLFQIINEENMLFIHPHLHEYLHMFNNETRLKVYNTLISMLNAKHPWRIHYELLNTFSLNARNFEKFKLETGLYIAVNLLINGGVWPIKAKCAQILALIIKWTNNTMVKNRTLYKIISSYKLSDTSQNRLLFIEFAKHARKYCSSSYFRDYLLSCVLSLSDDPVNSVRFKLAEALPSLKKCLQEDDIEHSKRIYRILEEFIENGPSFVSETALKSQIYMMSLKYWLHLKDPKQLKKNEAKSQFETLQLKIYFKELEEEKAKRMSTLPKARSRKLIPLSKPKKSLNETPLAVSLLQRQRNSPSPHIRIRTLRKQNSVCIRSYCNSNRLNKQWKP